MITETMQIKLGKPGPAADDDILGRRYTGAYPGIPPQQAWQRARAEWPIKRSRALKVREVVVVDRIGTVLCVATLDDVVATASGKCVLEGTVHPDDPRIGRPSVHPHPYQNCINYF
ncbi:hypothetical protein [Actinomycetospora soli]|uniref:hypothetical protein n=1 Tax=Actinomycetospora soli TaxID=2893887 RepID=UPI001E460490|nr:hypothetical protein [Actinomycetospora soli]MCD2191369.1 hypothetical protein [Actinomycetospora soli]